VFPEQGPAGWPGSNFGNQCDGNVYIVNGIHTLLLSGCYQIAEDIPICQAAGKTILLSLGGAIGQYEITSEQSAINFADFLWGAFGPKTAAWGTGPRPFGNAAVDGFDFAIELNGDYGMQNSRLPCYHLDY
jgi:chitinase